MLGDSSYKASHLPLAKRVTYSDLFATGGLADTSEASPPTPTGTCSREDQNRK